MTCRAVRDSHDQRKENHVSNTMIECASIIGTENARQALIAYRSLAEKTGVPVEEVARLMLSGESRCLFGADGKLRSREELRSLFGADGNLRSREEVRSLNRGRDPKVALAALRAKRQAWTNP